MHQLRRKTWRERFHRSSYFLGAVLVHLIVFLMVATIVIWKAPPPPRPEVFIGFVVQPPKTPPPPPTTPLNGGKQINPLDPDRHFVPMPTPPTTVFTSSNKTFEINTTKILSQTVQNLSNKLPQGTGQKQGDKGDNDDPGVGINPVGGLAANGASLKGIFYDLKQSRDHKATKMDVKKEQEVLRDFFANNWDESRFKQNYLCSSKPVYANELLIPFRPSTIGPSAFNLQDECKPGYWAVVYHVTFKPARSGDFCLAGFGDDFLVVRVNGENVLDSGFYPPVTNLARAKSYPHGPWVNDKDNKNSKSYGNAVVGQPFHLDADADLTMDVLISDAFPAGGGGRCGYFLMLLEAGKEYTAKDAHGNYLLPLFQINPNENVKREGEYPPFTCRAEDALIGQK